MAKLIKREIRVTDLIALQVGSGSVVVSLGTFWNDDEAMNWKVRAVSFPKVRPYLFCPGSHLTAVILEEKIVPDTVAELNAIG